MSSGKVSENLPDSVDIPGCDFFLQFIFRVNGNPGRGKPSDQIKKLVDHDLEVIPEVADEVYEYDSVKTSIRVVAYGNERTFRQAQDPVGMTQVVIESKFIQESSCKCSSLLVINPVIQIGQGLD